MSIRERESQDGIFYVDKNNPVKESAKAKQLQASNMLYFQALFLFAGLLFPTLSSPIISSPQETPAPQVFKGAPSSWVHPGVLNSKAQLDFVKAQVASDVSLYPNR